MILLTPREAADRLRLSRSALYRLVEQEGLPVVVISAPPGRRRIIRYDADELDTWIAGRRERQVQRTLNGERFTRRPA